MIIAESGLPALPKGKALAQEFVRYLAVGGLAFLVDYAVLWLCYESLGMHHQAATTLGFCAGLATNYLLCVLWVWRGTKATSLTDFATFTLIGLGGLALTWLLMWSFVDQAGTSPLIAKPFIAGIVLVWNFGLRRAFVFFR